MIRHFQDDIKGVWLYCGATRNSAPYAPAVFSKIETSREGIEPSYSTVKYLKQVAHPVLSIIELFEYNWCHSIFVISFSNSHNYVKKSQKDEYNII